MLYFLHFNEISYHFKKIIIKILGMNLLVYFSDGICCMDLSLKDKALFFLEPGTIIVGFNTFGSRKDGSPWKSFCSVANFM